MNEFDTGTWEAAQSSARIGVLLTDPARADNPITYANHGFTLLTGYSRSEALGRNCRFLQGAGTEPDRVADLQRAIAGEIETEIVLTNYRKDGTAFLNRLLVAPIHDAEGRLTAFFGVQREEAPQIAPDPPRTRAEARDAVPMLQELQHRVKNHLAMVVSFIRIQAGRGVDADSFRALSHRIEALALLYDDLERVEGSAAADAPMIDACAYVTRVARAVHGLEAREEVTLEVDCDPSMLTVNTCAQLGLLVSELVTNALKHAFVGRDRGKVWVRLHHLSGGGLRLVVEDDGVGIARGSVWPADSRSVADATDADGDPGKGVGGAIVKALTSALDAGLNVMTTLRGTTITVDLAGDDPASG